jgi:hypothetical protein
LGWQIFDSEYNQSFSSLGVIIKACENFHKEEQNQIEITILKYECILNGALGEFNMKPVNFQQIDPNFMLVHASADTVSHSVERIVEIYSKIGIKSVLKFFKKTIPLNGPPYLQNLQFLRNVEQKEVPLISGY